MLDPEKAKVKKGKVKRFRAADPGSLPLGKHSGRAALRAKLEYLGFEPNEFQLKRIFIMFKDLSDQVKEVHDYDLVALVEKYNNELQVELTKELNTLANEVGEDEPIVRFGLTIDSKIHLAPAMNQLLDKDLFQSIKRELLLEIGPINALCQRYSGNPNLPQAALVLPIVQRYKDELEKSVGDINFVVLYSLGSQLLATQKLSYGFVQSGDWPELDPIEDILINSICDLHGPLIMSSSVGQKLVSNAQKFSVTPESAIEIRSTLEELADCVALDQDIFEENDRQVFIDILRPIESDVSPNRTTSLGVIAAGSFLSIVAGSVALLEMGTTALFFAAPLGIGAWAGQRYIWEVIKKMPTFDNSAQKDAFEIEKRLSKTLEVIEPQQEAIVNHLRAFAEKYVEVFVKISQFRPEFAWAKKYFERLTRK